MLTILHNQQRYIPRHQRFWRYGECIPYPAIALTQESYNNVLLITVTQQRRNATVRRDREEGMR